jgi:hypothetical protein
MFIKKGTNIIINLALMNRDSRFPNPDKFDLKNFSVRKFTAIFDRKDATPPEGFDPFGYGQKGCAGSHLAKAEMKVIAITVQKQLRFKLLNKKDSLDTIKVHWDVAQQPVTPIFVMAMPTNWRPKKRIFVCGAHSVGKSYVHIFISSCIRTLISEFLKLHNGWELISELGRQLLTEMEITREDLHGETQIEYQRKV